MREREIEVCVYFTLITRRDLSAIEPKKNFILNTFPFQKIFFLFGAASNNQKHYLERALI
jgi:hypothetical protein